MSLFCRCKRSWADTWRSSRLEAYGKIGDRPIIGAVVRGCVMDDDAEAVGP